MAERFDVELVVVTVGANDLGFGRLALGCVAAWLFTPARDPHTCHRSAQTRIERAMPAMREGLLRALAAVRAVMREAGYRARDYRLLVSGYASPLPAAGELRHPQGTWARLRAGCPVWDADADWIARAALPWINATLAWAAAERGAGFLDVAPALAGHELCHRATGAASAHSPPRPARSEWFRALLPGQGSPREALHPNAFGQRAIGRCIGLAAAAAPGAWRCRRGGPRPGDAHLAPSSLATGDPRYGG